MARCRGAQFIGAVLTTKRIGQAINLSRHREAGLQPVFGMLPDCASSRLVRERVVGSIYKFDSHLTAASRQFQDMLEIIKFACPRFGASGLSRRSFQEKYWQTGRCHIFPALQKREVCVGGRLGSSETAIKFPELIVHIDRESAR